MPRNLAFQPNPPLRHRAHLENVDIFGAISSVLSNFREILE